MCFRGVPEASPRCFQGIPEVIPKCSARPAHPVRTLPLSSALPVSATRSQTMMSVSCEPDTSKWPGPGPQSQQQTPHRPREEISTDDRRGLEGALQRTQRCTQRSTQPTADSSQQTADSVQRTADSAQQTAHSAQYTARSGLHSQHWSQHRPQHRPEHRHQHANTPACQHASTCAGPRDTDADRLSRAPIQRTT